MLVSRNSSILNKLMVLLLPSYLLSSAIDCAHPGSQLRFSQGFGFRSRGSQYACLHHAVLTSGAHRLMGQRYSCSGHPQGPWWLFPIAGAVVVFELGPTSLMKAIIPPRFKGLLAGTPGRRNVHHLENDGETTKPISEESIKAGMIALIKTYKKELSPLMPPACRFLPTCSVYAVDAIEKFGPIKGGVLTAWRLMRCNPFAGYGIDYPQWPPPGWFAGEKW